jgi:LysM repeat protein
VEGPSIGSRRHPASRRRDGVAYDASVRTRLLGASLAAACLIGALAGCSDGDDDGAGATLPPIATTTTIPPTTAPPPATQPRFYEIQPGDTLIEIAAAYGLPILAIMEKNGIVDQNKIFAGQILELPDAASIVATSLPAPVAPATAAPAAVPAITTVAP